MKEQEKPLISIVMAVYNGEKFLTESIASILNQSFTKFEFIIINDGSNDDSLQIIETYAAKDDRIVIINQSNHGLAKSLNTGIKTAKGKYIARMDDDDISKPYRFEKQIKFLEANPEYIIVGGNADFINEDGTFVFKSSKKLNNADLKKNITSGNPFIHPSVMIKKSVFDSIDGYDTNINKFFEDRLLWYRLKDEGKFCNLEESLISYRMRKNSISTNTKKITRKLDLLFNDVISGNFSSEEIKIKIENISSSITKKDKELGYYTLLAKKYLYNRKDRKLFYSYLLKAILIKINLELISLFFVSCLPQKLILSLYSSLKNNFKIN